ncbi:MAG TPA: phage tail protein [Anaerolineales bacterium]|nr:phage tail protein [Anaerolineales bacterium]
MKPTTDRQKFYFLDGILGWRTAQTTNIAESRSALSLDADPQGPLSLNSADRSLGGLVLPQGFAFDSEGTLYLLDSNRRCIRRFEPGAAPDQSKFVDLPSIGGKGSDVRQFRAPANIAISGRDLYVVDPGARRVQVFAIHPAWPLRLVWDAQEPSVCPPKDETEPWVPVDLAAHAGKIYILDRRYGRVFRHEYGMTGLEEVSLKWEAARQWTRIRTDRDGRVYLLDKKRKELDVFDAEGRHVESVNDSSDVRDRFDPPSIRLLSLPSGKFFCLPASLMQRCGRRAPEIPPTPEMPVLACLSGETETAGMIFDCQGEPAKLDRAEVTGPASYVSDGVWRSKALDSGIFRCVWDRIVLDWGMDRLPSGTQVIVSTYTADQAAEPPVEKSPLWVLGFTFTGVPQAPPDPEADPAEKAGPPSDGADFAVRSREGRYLWLKIELRSDGYATPAVRALRAYFPRQSYLSYLPAIYSADDNSRDFLERFLMIFQTEWDDLERRLAEFHAHFDPQAMPEGKFVDELARWLALPLEQRWKFEQKRRLLQAVPKFYRRRGTLSGLRAFLQAYLHNLTDLPPDQQMGFPQVVEGFRLRQRHILETSTGTLPGTGSPSPLWSPEVVGRLQLDTFAREGESRLVSTGNPQLDLFNHYAHRFQVYIPACWLRTRDHVEMLRRALEAEKPAQAQYTLHLVEPRFRVGIQSTIGQDTLIGGIPRAQLWYSDPQRPPSAAPSSRLGYDTVLAEGTSTLLRLGKTTRMGFDTVVL